MAYTNGDIKRLGNRIVESKGAIGNEDLEILQEYRKSFTQPLTRTFSDLTQLKNRINRTGIIAFRLKRIKTIINKVIREPKMNLDRMGDIAGIRLILGSEQQIYKVLDLIQANFELSGRIRDYIKNPKDIGYKGIHIYIKDADFNKRIEVQLRTTEFHNWSTLVEITDLLYHTRLKELGYENNIELGKFHSLISSDLELTEEQANHIYKVLEKYNYITKLAGIFRKNNTEVKKQWLQVKPRSRYFLIESSSEKVPQLTGYTNFDKAEEEYFKKYKKDQEALVVLTSINKPSFEQISIAYANYILSYHNFIDDIESIIKELSIEALELKRLGRFRKIFKIYEELQANSILYVFTSVEEIFINRTENDKLIISSPNRISSKKQMLLKKDVKTAYKKQRISHRIFINEIYKLADKRSIQGFLCRIFLKKHSKRLKKRLKALSVEFETNK